MRKVEEVDGVDDLVLRHDQVDDTEIVLESVPDKGHFSVNEKPEFLIGRFERGQMFRAEISVQVAGLDARKFCKIVHHLKNTQSD